MQKFLKQRFRVDHPKFDARIHDVTLDVPIPSFFIMIKRPTEMGPLSAWQHARLSPEQAIRKGFLEAGQGIPYFRFLLGSSAMGAVLDFMNLTSFDHHCVFLPQANPTRAEGFRFIHEVEEEFRFSILTRHGRVWATSISRSVAQEGGAGVIVVEITTPDIQEVGLRVVRVLIPAWFPVTAFINTRSSAQSDWLISRS